MWYPYDWRFEYVYISGYMIRSLYSSLNTEQTYRAEERSNHIEERGATMPSSSY